MTERVVDEQMKTRGGSAPTVARRDHDAPSESRGGLLAGLASAGRWMGESDRTRGWEDYLADFLSAMLVWGGIGWLLDRWLGTEPWLLIAGIVLGNTMGIYLLWLRGEQAAARDERDRAARTAATRERRTRDEPRGGQP